MVSNSLPGSSRVWVYQSDLSFTPEQVEIITQKLTVFLTTWDYHGTRLNAAAEVFYNQFIVIFVDEQVQKAGGCSIDKSVALIKEIEQDFGVELMNRMNLAYRQDQKIVVDKMSDFQRAIREGQVNEKTVVFNNLVTNKDEFIKEWEVPAAESWHKQLF